jgi:hypothetical protein
MTLTLTPQQMDTLIDGDLAGYTVLERTITDHEDDGRLYKHLAFTDPAGTHYQFNYLWSPWDGNDYTIFAGPDDAVQVKAAPPAPVVVPEAPAAPARAPVTHTLKDVQKAPDFQEAVTAVSALWQMPTTTLAAGKRAGRDLAERFGLSDKDAIEAIQHPQKYGCRPSKAKAAQTPPQGTLRLEDLQDRADFREAVTATARARLKAKNVDEYTGLRDAFITRFNLAFHDAVLAINLPATYGVQPLGEATPVMPSAPTPSVSRPRPGR